MRVCEKLRKIDTLTNDVTNMKNKLIDKCFISVECGSMAVRRRAKLTYAFIFHLEKNPNNRSIEKLTKTSKEFRVLMHSKKGAWRNSSSRGKRSRSWGGLVRRLLKYQNLFLLILDQICYSSIFLIRLEWN